MYLLVLEEEVWHVLIVFRYLLSHQDEHSLVIPGARYPLNPVVSKDEDRVHMQ